MNREDAREALREGYYGDTLETEEVLGMLVRYFPEVYSQDLELEEMVAQACWS